MALNEIIKEKGNILLTAGVATALLGIVFGGELTGILGNRAEIENHIDYTGYSNVVSGIVSKTAPQIQLNETVQVCKGTAVDIRSLFDIKLHGQDVFVSATVLQPSAFRVNSLTDKQGNDILALYNTADGTVTFTSEGIYTIQVSITDEYNSKTEATFKIPVEE